MTDLLELENINEIELFLDNQRLMIDAEHVKTIKKIDSFISKKWVSIDETGIMTIHLKNKDELIVQAIKPETILSFASKTMRTDQSYTKVVEDITARKLTEIQEDFTTIRVVADFLLLHSV